MGRYIDTDDFEKQIKPYDTDDPVDMAMYNFAHNKMLCTPTADVTEQVNDAHNEGYDVGYWAGRRDYEPKWIPVTERLPEEFTRSLCTMAWNGVEVCEYQHKRWYMVSCLQPIPNEAVTAWMPLPEPYRDADMR